MMRPATVPQVRALLCPNCGGTVELKGYAQSINVVCIQCLTVLDATTPSLRILQKVESKQRIMPLIPLGTRGKLKDQTYEVIGFQVRAIEVDGIEYSWEEYLLLNPYRGYLYLTQYQGHWNVVRTRRALPVPVSGGKKRTVEFGGAKYTHFQTAAARTKYIMGEFPWQVRVGETVQVEDYIAPPSVLSAELTASEAVWSKGEYLPGKTIWQTFGLKGQPPTPTGIYANQPSPYRGRIASVWKTWLMLAGLLFLTVIGLAIVSPNEEVFRQRYSFDAANKSEASFVTSGFELKGRPSNVEIEINTSLANDWAYFSLVLINDATGDAYDTGKEVSYYFGRDSDGSWTEGSKNATATIPNVPSGHYYLRVEPEMNDDNQAHTMNYDITVKRGVPGAGLFIASFFLLLIPPIFVSWRAFSFENTRWAESDYGAMISSSSGDDD